MVYDPIKRKLDYQKNKERDLATNKKWRDSHKDWKKKWSKQRYEKFRKTDPISFMIKHAKARAKKKQLEYSLNKEDIIIPEKCPYMRKPFIWGDYNYTPSIDRIDSSKGYTKDNIEIISALANRMKWCSTSEELLTFAEGVIARMKGGCP